MPLAIHRRLWRRIWSLRLTSICWCSPHNPWPELVGKSLEPIEGKVATKNFANGPNGGLDQVRMGKNLQKRTPTADCLHAQSLPGSDCLQGRQHHLLSACWAAGGSYRGDVECRHSATPPNFAVTIIMQGPVTIILQGTVYRIYNIYTHTGEMSYHFFVMNGIYFAV